MMVWNHYLHIMTDCLHMRATNTLSTVFPRFLPALKQILHYACERC